ncbi:extracellular solute-binding protein [Nonomuraea sp. JJY05]|uniref:extracellular solute-binding protein n=1 Tax=Nonomuraea sp. JJY05 TaxID=3350255 RepID=UPI00373E5850
MRFPSRPAVIATLAALALTSCGTGADPGAGSVSLTIAANSISGGKNSESADWIKRWVIPEFERTHRDVKVLFRPSGVDDEQYKTKIALDLKSRTGADVIDVDGIWVGEFAQAGRSRSCCPPSSSSPSS